MRKIIFILVVFIGGVSLFYKAGSSGKEVNYNNEKRSVFISYIELDNSFSNASYEEAYTKVNTMIDNVSKFGFNEVIVQVRSFADAIYKSDIFPSRYTDSYDLMSIFIEICHKKGISFLAWVNPYRISSSSDTNSISPTNPAYRYIGTDYIYVNKGIYFNPSKIEVRKLVVNGVSEILKYDVDGVMFDDYFYPDNEIDMKDYSKYIEDNGYIDKKQYNLNVINELIYEVHEVCKSENVLFGVSPDGNIDNNYNKVFADVKKWGSDDKYIDFIMPQIYYGFYNETKPFNKVSEEWESIITNPKIELRIALAFYKVGTIDKYAGSGSEEWLNNDDIIMREIIISRNLNKYRGFSLFRYGYLFDTKLYNKMTVRESQNIKKVLN